MPFTYERSQEKKEECMIVTGYDGEISYLNIPGQIEGLPVRAVAGNAFSWRKDIRLVDIPSSVRELRGFCFYNCPNLERIRLHDSVEDYYDGVIRHCAGLRQVDLTIERDNYRLAREMLADNDRQLDFYLHSAKGTSCLTFPDYFSDYVEDTRARAFHTKIEGSGYVYRECIGLHDVSYTEYDSMFFRAASDNPRVAARIAINRLMYPFSIRPEAVRQYRTYLKENSGAVLLDLTQTEDVERIRFLADEDLIDTRTMDAALKKASGKNQTQICGILMDYQKRHETGSRQPQMFSLDNLF